MPLDPNLLLLDLTLSSYLLSTIVTKHRGLAFVLHFSVKLGGYPPRCIGPHLHTQESPACSWIFHHRAGTPHGTCPRRTSPLMASSTLYNITVIVVPASVYCRNHSVSE